jgi:hypothetical protein
VTERPGFLIIGGYRYRVENARGLIRTEGEHRRCSGRLLLDPAVPESSPDREREVLVHEILHAIRNNGGHDEEIGDDHKERSDATEHFICSVQWGLVEVLRANPQLVSYLVRPDGE